MKETFLKYFDLMKMKVKKGLKHFNAINVKMKDELLKYFNLIVKVKVKLYEKIVKRFNVINFRSVTFFILFFFYCFSFLSYGDILANFRELCAFEKHLTRLSLHGRRYSILFREIDG